MIVESSTQASLSYSQMIEKDRAAAMDHKTAPTDNPPAYSDLGSDSDVGLAHGPSLHRRSRRDRRSRDHGRGHLRQNQSLLPPPRRPAQSDRQHGCDAQASTSAAPSASVDQVHITDRKHNIEGTFYIDPTVPMLDPSRRQKTRSDEPIPHASFRTRSNTIDLNIGTAGDVHKAGKANVVVGSRDGFVKVNVLPTPPSKPRLGLTVSSRQGTVVVFIPEDFVGMVQLASRKGALNVLPVLAGRMKIIKAADHEIIFIIGNANDHSLDGLREASYCDISTRNGEIVVGLSGRDQYVAPVGFWKKLGGMLKGS
ncbi:hypothetical protein BDN70DRAFT_874959 [Pholiota conissans]|uniref:DUF7330 domain-containing protein n=1 Tax=Pholiota conissans TaxID=109636 RepID=A0A9P6D3Z8_9AGAR|nr:hypothetical protein BDN70DRAFT_874959 [Pholiota conissans]